MTFRSNDGDRDKFDHSLHHYTANKFDQSLHHYPKKIIYPEQKYYETKRRLECNSIFFNGSSSYIDCGNDSSLNNISVNHAHSIAANIYILGDEPTSGCTIVSYAHNATDRTGIMYRDGILRAGVYDGSAIGGSKLLNLNQWYHIVFTYDLVNVLLYVNGIIQTGSDTPYLSNVNKLIIGAATDISKFFNGYIKDIIAYERTLSATESLNLSNNLPVSDHNLVLDLPLKNNNSTDTIVKDLSGNNNDGTLHDCEWNCEWIREKHKVI